MYIPYDKIGASIALFMPVKWRKAVRKLFNRIKIEANCRYVHKNEKEVIYKLKREVKNRKLRVAFFIYDETKWKCQSLYDLLKSSKIFDPIVLVSKNCSPSGNMNNQTNDSIKRCYEFFKNKGLNVEYSYDCKSEKFIALDKFSPDIIFYQHPWYIETSQGPVYCSKFALTYYVPYYLPNTTLPQDYYLRFHRYVHKYYVLNDYLVKRYSKLMANKGRNLVAAGTPQLDYFYFNDLAQEKKEYVIYAPHWTVNHNKTMAYSTFLWSGMKVLEFAENHPEINWIFKPHPLLKSALLVNKLWSEEQIDQYYDRWKKVGKYYDSGDYLDLFAKSYAMITDCGSFLIEFFMTEMPLIRLVSPDAVPCYDFINKMNNVFYKAQKEDELEQILEDIVINKNDVLKEQRQLVLNELGFKDNYAAQNILNDMKKDIGLIK